MDRFPSEDRPDSRGRHLAIAHTLPTRPVTESVTVWKDEIDCRTRHWQARTDTGPTLAAYGPVITSGSTLPESFCSRKKMNSPAPTMMMPPTIVRISGTSPNTT